MRARLVMAVAAATTLLAADARAGSSGPMVRGDGGSGPSATGSEIAPDSATLLILDRGRTWSLNGGPFKMRQRVTLARGSTLTVIDGVSPYRFIQVAGKPVTKRNGTSMTSKALTTVVFGEAGVYRFRVAAALTVTVTVR